jgi:uncharacterized protein YeeX (DUF496 family)
MTDPDSLYADSHPFVTDFSTDPPTGSSPNRHRLPRGELRGLLEGAKPKDFVTLPLSARIAQTSRESVRPAEHRFDHALEKYRYTAIIDLAFQESNDNQHPFRVSHHFKSLSLWRTKGTCLLGDIPLRLLQSLLDGTLDRKVAAEDPELHGYYTGNSYWMLRQEGSFAPIHYVRIFGDEHGKPPSPRQLFLVLDDLEKYVSGDPQHDEICAEIDDMSGRSKNEAVDIRAGFHHFFNGIVTRPPILLTFIEAQRQYLATIELDQHDEPIPHALQYVGFTINVERRASEHEGGSTSWLTSLFDAVCHRLFQRPEGGPVFKFELYVMTFPINRDECKLGEELLARMCHSYHYTGLGFNIQPAGVSSVDGQLKNLSEAEAESTWRDRVALRDGSPVLGRQISEDLETYLPKWNELLDYKKKTPGVFREIQIEKRNAEVTRILGSRPNRADCRDRIELLERLNRREEAEISTDATREAMKNIHLDTEKRHMDRLNSIRHTPTSS